MTPRRTLLSSMLLSAALGCHGSSTDQAAVSLVRTYDARLIDAYRTSDVEVMDPWVGSDELRKLTGLIGVKRDMGETLDAQLLELRVDRVVRDGDGVRVFTHERWRYVPRRIGDGAPAGPESTDAYALSYRLGVVDGKERVLEVEFTEPPVVGTPVAPGRIDARDAHGLPPVERSSVVPAPRAAGGMR